MISKFGISVIALLACSATAAPPPCTCARNFTPVCGSDGVTYANECLLVCAQQTNSGLSLAREGSCEENAGCICTLQYQPVCGTDGTTYSNPCKARCSKVEVSHAGECQSVLVAQPPCTCDKTRKPVCGSDGKTYTNDCELNCATQYNSRLSIAHFGSCQGSDLNIVDNEPQCSCTDNIAPVCGSDGVTYSNDCLLNCATKHNSRLSIAHFGSCNSDGSGQDCTCARSLNPVCGTDGVTYNNECLLRCAGAEVAREGECEARG